MTMWFVLRSWWVKMWYPEYIICDDTNEWMLRVSEYLSLPEEQQPVRLHTWINSDKVTMTAYLSLCTKFHRTIGIVNTRGPSFGTTFVLLIRDFWGNKPYISLKNSF